MIRHVLSFSAAVTLLLLLPQLVVAQGTPLYIYCGDLPGCASTGLVPFGEYITGILQVLLVQLPVYIYILGTLFVMIGGAYILFGAAGDENVTKGKNTIIWSVIGVFVANFAVVLVNIVVLEVTTRIPGPDLLVSGINTVAGTIFDLLYISLIGIAVFCGMRMVVAMGKEDEFDKSKMGLFYAALGAIIINIAEQVINAFVSL